MISLIQRVSAAAVTVDGKIISQISHGMLVLVAVETADTPADIAWTAQKLATLRIFKNPANDKYFDLDLQQSNGSLLLVSNFTLAADTGSGRRPSLSPAAPPAAALPLFDQLVAACRALHLPTHTGQFGAEMQVSLTNEGPATFLLKSQQSPQQNP